MSGAGVPDRIRWAVELLDPAPTERVLEIGCGPGAAAEVVCERLDGGTMLAIDRSAVAVSRARKRNTGPVEAGVLRVEQCSLSQLDVPAASFDLAFAVNVNVFWTSGAAAELRLLRSALGPGGRLAVLYGPSPAGSGSAKETDMLDTVKRALERHDYAEPTVVRDSRGSGVLAYVGPD